MTAMSSIVLGLKHLKPTAKHIYSFVYKTAKRLTAYSLYFATVADEYYE